MTWQWVVTYLAGSALFFAGYLFGHAMGRQAAVNDAIRRALAARRKREEDEAQR